MIFVIGIVAYIVCYLGLWVRVDHLRGPSSKPSIFPATLGFLTGSVVFTYLWGGGHREAADAKLTAWIWATRVAQLFVLVSFVAQVVV